MKLALLVCPVSFLRTVLLIPIALIYIRESKLFLFNWRGFLVKAESFRKLEHGWLYDYSF